MSVARLKRTNRVPVQAVPKPGTKTREIWDLFDRSRGKVITHRIEPGQRHLIKVMRITYGLDIRACGPHRWCLVGEWLEDGTYADYLAVNQEETP